MCHYNAWDLNFYAKAYKIIKNSDFNLIYGPKTQQNSKINKILKEYFNNMFVLSSNIIW